MQSHVNETVKVGFAVVLAIALIWGALAIFRGDVVGTGNTYPVQVSFERAVGVSKGMSVKLAGSHIGYVQSIDFDNDARRTVASVRIHNGVDIREDSYAVISQDGLIDEKYMAIYEPEGASDRNVESGGQISGTSEAGLNDLISEASVVLGSINELLGDDQLGGVVNTLNARLDGTMDKVDTILINADDILSGNRQYIDGTMQNVHAMSVNLLALSENFEALSVQVKQLAADPKYRERLDQVTDDMTVISANIANMTTEINALVSDDQVQTDVKDSVRLTKETLEEAKATMVRFQETLDNVDGAIGNANDLMGSAGGVMEDAKGKLEQIDRVGEAVDVKLGMNVRAVDIDRDDNLGQGDHYVGDMNVAVGYNDVYLQMGAESIGEDNDFNFLLGYGDLSGLSFRGGVYRSELGLGAAYFTPSGWGAETMWYDTEDPKVNALGYIPVMNDLRVVVGAEDIGNDPMATVGVGVEF